MEHQLPDGYEFAYVPAKGKDNKMCIEIVLKTRIEFNLWLAAFSQKNNVIWRKKRGDKKFKDRLEIFLACHHAKMRQKGLKTTDTKYVFNIRLLVHRKCIFEILQLYLNFVRHHFICILGCITVLSLKFFSL